VSVKIKICGVTRAEDARLACELGADLIGLNFYQPSPRCIPLDIALEIRRAVAGRAALVGVFVNAERSFVQRVAADLALDFIQFHGDEDESALAGWPLLTIRAYRLRAESPADVIRRSRADYVLLDSYDPALFGGTGRALPLAQINGIDLRRTIISGGLDPERVAQAAALKPWAVDVASGVESAPGVKDAAKLRSFIVNAKSSR
jgi:phosphoribosylanthranilate isomerase